MAEMMKAAFLYTEQTGRAIWGLKMCRNPVVEWAMF
jgi:hypothetical protein